MNPIVTEVEGLVTQFVPTIASFVASKADKNADLAGVNAATAQILQGLLALQTALVGKAAPAAA